MMPNQYVMQGVQPIDHVRRRLLKLSLCAGFTFLAPIKGLASIPDFSTQEKALSLYDPSTREALSTVYWINGHYIPDALAEISHFMRDHRTNEVKPIDRDLLNVMYSIKRKLDYKNPFHVISGYRCRKTNELLRRKGRNAARNSYHLSGKAADIRLPDCRLSVLRTAALETKGGGVGYNPSSNFVHIDVGPIRYWSYKNKKK